MILPLFVTVGFFNLVEVGKTVCINPFVEPSDFFNLANSLAAVASTLVAIEALKLAGWPFKKTLFYLRRRFSTLSWSSKVV